MTVKEAMSFFRDQSALYNKLETLNKVGLGYIRLGQAATTFSGGEAQRIKLATELSRRATGKTLYILDEPTTGLHFADIDRLLNVLNLLVDQGNTVLIIEHNLDVIKAVDWIIDMGPGGGDKGGQVVVTGTPTQVAKVKGSYTGEYLKKNDVNKKQSLTFNGCFFYSSTFNSNLPFSVSSIANDDLLNTSLSVPGLAIIKPSCLVSHGRWVCP